MEISYSKEWEDIILRTLLYNIENGHYIDVGAGNPIDSNVTNYFYEQGWNGVNIEPLTEPYILLKNQRERDINLCVGIGEKHCVKSLYQNENNSSFEEIKDASPCKKEMYTLSEIYRVFCTEFEDIHFCYINTNGYEADVLKGIDNWGVFRPWIYAIKSTVADTRIPSYSDWEYILLDQGYFLAYAYGHIRYYVSNEHRSVAYNTAAINMQIKNFTRYVEGSDEFVI